MPNVFGGSGHGSQNSKTRGALIMTGLLANLVKDCVVEELASTPFFVKVLQGFPGFCFGLRV